MERKQAVGMSYREALRCLKRHLARVLFKTMQRVERLQTSEVISAPVAPGSVAIAV